MKTLIPLVVLALGLAARPLTAQSRTPPYQVSLDRVEVLTAEGRIMAARDALEAWLELMEPSASRVDLQRAIWLRGRLTVDPSMAEADFRRLVLEYPGGPYSDDALWRLGLSAAARGDSAQAQNFFISLARDYPSGPLAGKAEDWLRGHGVEAMPPPRSPEPEVSAASSRHGPGGGCRIVFGPARGLSEPGPGSWIGREAAGRWIRPSARADTGERSVQSPDRTVLVQRGGRGTRPGARGPGLRRDRGLGRFPGATDLLLSPIVSGQDSLYPRGRPARAPYGS